MVREPASQTASALGRNVTTNRNGGDNAPAAPDTPQSRIGPLYSWPLTVASSLVMVVPMVW